MIRLMLRVAHKLENTSKSCRLYLQRRSLGGQARAKPKGSHPASIGDAPNDASAWEDVYLTPVQPVRTLSGPVAKAVAGLTQPGDVLLETGCGSGSISAELATAGRTIELCDFSEKILARASELFRSSGLIPPRTTVCDITRPLPWPDRAVDVAWSSGVLEHWTDEELDPILREMVRISRKKVISLVPYAGCVFYRFAKHLAESGGHWPYGREIPRGTLRGVFAAAGLINIREFVIWPESAPALLSLTDPELEYTVNKWWSSLEEDDPVKAAQGYLLVTVGDILDRTEP